MKTIPLSEVIIPENRARRTFNQDDIEKLGHSIDEIGLIHLPVLRNGNELVSGERRFKAIKWLDGEDISISYLGQAISWGHLPYAPFESLSDDDAKEIELQENAIRVDLPWQEYIVAVKELHEHRRAKNPNWTPKDTAKEIGLAPGSIGPLITDRITLAKNLDRPEVRAAKSEKEAMKVLRMGMERDLSAELLKRQGRVKTVHTLIHGDFLHEVNKLPRNYFDVIVTDPPWGVEADTFEINIKYNMPQHTYDDKYITAWAHYVMLAKAGYADLTKGQAHIYTFCSFHMFPDLFTLFHEAGWDVWPRPIIWWKHTGSLPKPDLGPRYEYDTILFANKGNKPTAGLFPDVIDAPMPQNKIHAAEKPVEVYTNLLRRSVVPGDLVLDPFCGSGPIFPAAKAVGCIATGIDSDENAIALCNSRLKDMM